MLGFIINDPKIPTFRNSEIKKILMNPLHADLCLKLNSLLQYEFTNLSYCSMLKRFQISRIVFFKTADFKNNCYLVGELQSVRLG